MKPLSIIAILTGILLLSACGPRKVHIAVEVQDVLSGQKLDSAQVDLYRNIRGGNEQKLQTAYSDESGMCSFVIEVDESYSYWVEASRTHFIKTLSEDGGTYIHQQRLQIADSIQAQLFLESILPPDPERFEKMYPKVPISQVIAAIAADEWSWSFLPKISWEDVPILLNQGADSSFVKNYPRNLRSTYRPDSIRAGLVSLWLVEALRKQKIKGEDEFYALTAPSRAPVLGTRRGNPSGYNSVEQLQAAQAAYTAWWEAVPVDSLGRVEAIKKNPLAGKSLSWM
ncbi:MAG: DUF4943 family protein [Bacteroidota bacterium]